MATTWSVAAHEGPIGALRGTRRARPPDGSWPGHGGWRGRADRGSSVGRSGRIPGGARTWRKAGLPLGAGGASAAGRCADRRHFLEATRSGLVHAEPGRAAQELRRPGGDRHRERAPVHRAARFAGATEGGPGQPDPGREDGLARPAHRRHRARDQEPAELRQQLRGPVERAARRAEAGGRRRCWPSRTRTSAPSCRTRWTC